MNELLDHLLDPSLTDEQRTEAVKALPPEQIKQLIPYLCQRVNNLAMHVVANAEELWDNR